MKKFNKVAVVGTGLIGGSIAIALKKKKLCRRIVGISLHKRSLVLAKKIKAIDAGSLSLEAIRDADLVILATPVSIILSLAGKISRLISKDCLVFDVGSTKARIVDRLSGLFPCFVGTHPLAGSEKKGIINASAGLFRDSMCIITPLKATDHAAVEKVRELWNLLGAKVLMMSPIQHDRILGFVSHLPHLAAFSLINAIPEEFLKFSPPSLKDATRIAASDNVLWTDIILDNRQNMLEAISAYQKQLEKIKSAIRKNDSAGLSGIFQRAKKRKEYLI